MKILNDFNQQTNFKAKLEIHKNLKKTKKLEKISKLFEAKTQKSTKDVLTIDFDTDINEYYYVLNHDDGLYLERPLENILEHDSEKDIVNKLVKVFKCLKREEKGNNKKKIINEELADVKNIYTNFKDKANALTNDGKLKFAQRYVALARRNRVRFEHLIEQRKQSHEKMINDINKIAGDDKDFAGYVNAITEIIV